MPENTAHPTQKPEKLLAKLILASSNENDVVLDPFLGSGSTSVTAKKLNRHYVGIEQNDQHCVWVEKCLEMAEIDKTIQGYTDGVFWERNTNALQKKSRNPKPIYRRPKMYNKSAIDRLIGIIEENNGIGDKEKLSDLVQKEFCLIKDRKVFANDDFAIRFSKSEHKRMSNTVLSLSALQKYDDKPFFVCIVASAVNYLLLANTTFLKKISHSSQELRVDNIKGSFNGGDIMPDFQGIDNDPRNFQALFAYHKGFSFQDNLERLVESTNGIAGRVQKFYVTPAAKTTILNSVSRASAFVASSHYADLHDDLAERVAKVQEEIAIAVFIDNVNVRGRVIEYLITDNGSPLKNQIIKALHGNESLPEFKTDDKLGDYAKDYPDFSTETDIKTKALFLDGNPKAYNVDKLLEFLAKEKSVYMIYLLGIGDDGKIIARLCSIYDERLIRNTNVIHHWAGRNSRGVAQFIGTGLAQILSEKDETVVSEKLAVTYLENLIER